MQIDLSATDVYLWLLGGIYCCHHYLGREFITSYHCLSIGDYESGELIDADILHVDIADKIMQHLSFGIAHIALKFGEHGDGSRYRHSFKHILFPVFVERILSAFHGSGEVCRDDAALTFVCYHREDALAVCVDALS